MTATEAAVRLNITYDLCLRYIRTGILKGSKRGRKWKVDPESVRSRLIQVSNRRARRAQRR